MKGFPSLRFFILTQKKANPANPIVTIIILHILIIYNFFLLRVIPLFHVLLDIDDVILWNNFSSFFKLINQRTLQSSVFFLRIRIILESFKTKKTFHLSKKTAEFANRNFLRESILFNVHRNLFCASPKLLFFYSPFLSFLSRVTP